MNLDIEIITKIIVLILAIITGVVFLCILFFACKTYKDKNSTENNVFYRIDNADDYLEPRLSYSMTNDIPVFV